MELQFLLILNCISLALFTATLAEHSRLTNTPSMQILNPWWLVAGGCAATLFYAWYLGPLDSVTISSAVLIVAAYSLYKPTSRWILALSVGLLTSSLFALALSNSLPVWVASLLPLSVSVLAVTWISNGNFLSSEQVREDALLIVVLSSLLILVTPIVEQGWHSAHMLNVRLEHRGAEQPDPPMPTSWLFILLATFLVAGAVFSLLKRRYKH